MVNVVVGYDSTGHSPAEDAEWFCSLRKAAFSTAEMQFFENATIKALPRLAWNVYPS